LKDQHEFRYNLIVFHQLTKMLPILRQQIVMRRDETRDSLLLQKLLLRLAFTFLCNAVSFHDRARITFRFVLAKIVASF